MTFEVMNQASDQASAVATVQITTNFTSLVCDRAWAIPRISPATKPDPANDTESNLNEKA